MNCVRKSYAEKRIIKLFLSKDFSNYSGLLRNIDRHKIFNKLNVNLEIKGVLIKERQLQVIGSRVDSVYIAGLHPALQLFTR